VTIPGAGGQTPPRPDQAYKGSAGAVVSPGTSSVVRATKIIVSGTGEGVFVYNGTPALGNPPIDYLSNSATDPFGNTLPESGTVAYASSSIWAALTAGQLIFADGSVLASVAGSFRMENAAGAAVVLSGADTVDLVGGSVFLNGGDNLVNIFGMSQPLNYPLAGTASNATIVGCLNSLTSGMITAGLIS
jgi:hypothetical protein